MSITETINGYTISDDRNKTDLEFVHREIANSYWAKKIPFETLKRGIENSICFNVFKNEKQIAFARVISDQATFAYLCDVIVTETERGNGIGKMLMKFILKHPDLQGLRRFTLGTKDAHGLYEGFGFKPLSFPDRHMEINRSGLYEQQS